MNFSGSHDDKKTQFNIKAKNKIKIEIFDDDYCHIQYNNQNIQEKNNLNLHTKNKHSGKFLNYSNLISSGSLIFSKSISNFNISPEKLICSNNSVFFIRENSQNIIDCINNKNNFKSSNSNTTHYHKTSIDKSLISDSTINSKLMRTVINIKNLQSNYSYLYDEYLSLSRTIIRDNLSSENYEYKFFNNDIDNYIFIQNENDILIRKSRRNNSDCKIIVNKENKKSINLNLIEDNICVKPLHSTKNNYNHLSLFAKNNLNMRINKESRNFDSGHTPKNNTLLDITKKNKVKYMYNNNLTKKNNLLKKKRNNYSEISNISQMNISDSNNNQVSYINNSLSISKSTLNLKKKNNKSATKNNIPNSASKSYISNKSIFYSPSTLCNYYQYSNELTPLSVGYSNNRNNKKKNIETDKLTKRNLISEITECSNNNNNILIKDCFSYNSDPDNNFKNNFNCFFNRKIETIERNEEAKVSRKENINKKDLPFDLHFNKVINQNFLIKNFQENKLNVKNNRNKDMFNYKNENEEDINLNYNKSNLQFDQNSISENNSLNFSISKNSISNSIQTLVLNKKDVPYNIDNNNQANKNTQINIINMINVLNSSKKTPTKTIKYTKEQFKSADKNLAVSSEKKDSYSKFSFNFENYENFKNELNAYVNNDVGKKIDNKDINFTINTSNNMISISKIQGNYTNEDFEDLTASRISPTIEFNNIFTHIDANNNHLFKNIYFEKENNDLHVNNKSNLVENNNFSSSNKNNYNNTKSNKNENYNNKIYIKDLKKKFNEQPNGEKNQNIFIVNNEINNNIKDTLEREKINVKLNFDRLNDLKMEEIFSSKFNSCTNKRVNNTSNKPNINMNKYVLLSKSSKKKILFEDKSNSNSKNFVFKNHQDLLMEKIYQNLNIKKKTIENNSTANEKKDSKTKIGLISNKFALKSEFNENENNIINDLDQEQEISKQVTTNKLMDNCSDKKTIKKNYLFYEKNIDNLNSLISEENTINNSAILNNLNEREDNLNHTRKDSNYILNDISYSHESNSVINKKLNWNNRSSIKSSSKLDVITNNISPLNHQMNIDRSILIEEIDSSENLFLNKENVINNLEKVSEQETNQKNNLKTSQSELSSNKDNILITERKAMQHNEENNIKEKNSNNLYMSISELHFENSQNVESLQKLLEKKNNNSNDNKNYDKNSSSRKNLFSSRLDMDDEKYTENNVIREDSQELNYTNKQENVFDNIIKNTVLNRTICFKNTLSNSNYKETFINQKESDLNKKQVHNYSKSFSSFNKFSNLSINVDNSHILFNSKKLYDKRNELHLKRIHKKINNEKKSSFNDIYNNDENEIYKKEKITLFEKIFKSDLKIDLDLDKKNSNNTVKVKGIKSEDFDKSFGEIKKNELYNLEGEFDTILKKSFSNKISIFEKEECNSHEKINNLLNKKILNEMLRDKINKNSKNLLNNEDCNSDLSDELIDSGNKSNNISNSNKNIIYSVISTKDTKSNLDKNKAITYESNKNPFILYSEKDQNEELNEKSFIDKINKININKNLYCKKNNSFVNKEKIETIKISHKEKSISKHKKNNKDLYLDLEENEDEAYSDKTDQILNDLDDIDKEEFINHVYNILKENKFIKDKKLKERKRLKNMNILKLYSKNKFTNSDKNNIYKGAANNPKKITFDFLLRQANKSNYYGITSRQNKIEVLRQSKNRSYSFSTIGEFFGNKNIKDNKLIIDINKNSESDIGHNSDCDAISIAKKNYSTNKKSQRKVIDINTIQKNKNHLYNKLKTFEILYECEIDHNISNVDEKIKSNKNLKCFKENYFIEKNLMEENNKQNQEFIDNFNFLNDKSNDSYTKDNTFRKKLFNFDEINFKKSFFKELSRGLLSNKKFINDLSTSKKSPKEIYTSSLLKNVIHKVNRKYKHRISLNKSKRRKKYYETKISKTDFSKLFNNYQKLPLSSFIFKNNEKNKKTKKLKNNIDQTKKSFLNYFESNNDINSNSKLYSKNNQDNTFINNVIPYSYMNLNSNNKSMKRTINYNNSPFLRNVNSMKIPNTDIKLYNLVLPNTKHNSSYNKEKTNFFNDKKMIENESNKNFIRQIQKEDIFNEDYDEMMKNIIQNKNNNHNYNKDEKNNIKNIKENCRKILFKNNTKINQNKIDYRVENDLNMRNGIKNIKTDLNINLRRNSFANAKINKIIYDESLSNINDKNNVIKNFDNYNRKLTNTSNNKIDRSFNDFENPTKNQDELSYRKITDKGNNIEDFVFHNYYDSIETEENMNFVRNNYVDTIHTKINSHNLNLNYFVSSYHQTENYKIKKIRLSKKPERVSEYNISEENNLKNPNNSNLEIESLNGLNINNPVESDVYKKIFGETKKTNSKEINNASKQESKSGKFPLDFKLHSSNSKEKINFKLDNMIKLEVLGGDNDICDETD